MMMMVVMMMVMMMMMMVMMMMMMVMMVMMSAIEWPISRRQKTTHSPTLGTSLIDRFPVFRCANENIIYY